MVESRQPTDAVALHRVVATGGVQRQSLPAALGRARAIRFGQLAQSYKQVLRQ
jgi:hypothetical protein